jgi:hypothetical protein
VVLASRPDGNLHVMAEGNQEVHESFNRKIAGTVAHQRRNVGLLGAQYGPRLRLREMAIFDDAVDLQRKMRLELLAFRIGKTARLPRGG